MRQGSDDSQALCEQARAGNDETGAASTNEVERIQFFCRRIYVGMQDGAGEKVEMQNCHKCGRHFAVDRIAKHSKVCKGADNKQAKEKYDPMVASKTAPKGNEKIETKPAKWKTQHNELQQAMKEMRKIKAIQAKGGDLSSLPPPPRSDYSHYIDCKYCGRKFAPDVAEKHIPKCANIINKPGGIKPSTIQSKYIGGTGSGNTKPGIVGTKPAVSSKPGIVGTKPVVSSKPGVLRGPVGRR